MDGGKDEVVAHILLSQIKTVESNVDAVVPGKFESTANMRESSSFYLSYLSSNLSY